MFTVFDSASAWPEHRACWLRALAGSAVTDEIWKANCWRGSHMVPAVFYSRMPTASVARRRVARLAAPDAVAKVTRAQSATASQIGVHGITVGAPATSLLSETCWVVAARPVATAASTVPTATATADSAAATFTIWLRTAPARASRADSR